MMNLTKLSNSSVPMALFKNDSEYSVLLNLFGYKKGDIYIDVDRKTKEFGIYAGKDTGISKTAQFWIFGVPRDGQIKKMRVKYKGGGLLVTIPRANLEPAAA